MNFLPLLLSIPHFHRPSSKIKKSELVYSTNLLNSLFLPKHDKRHLDSTLTSMPLELTQHQPLLFQQKIFVFPYFADQFLNRTESTKTLLFKNCLIYKPFDQRPYLLGCSSSFPVCVGYLNFLLLEKGNFALCFHTVFCNMTDLMSYAACICL